MLDSNFRTHPSFKDGMNIYMMFVANEGRCPFWVTKWTSQAFLVTAVGDLKGEPPYYGNPVVSGELYSLFHNNERTDTLWKKEDRTISAGTFNWTWLEPVSGMTINGGAHPRPARRHL